MESQPPLDSKPQELRDFPESFNFAGFITHLRAFERAEAPRRRLAARWALKRKERQGEGLRAGPTCWPCSLSQEPAASSSETRRGA